MAHKFIVRIGYTDYSCEQADAVALLDIASRMKRVKQDGYTGPYFVLPDQEPWIDEVRLQEVLEPEPVEEPDKFGNATNAVAGGS